MTQDAGQHAESRYAAPDGPAPGAVARFYDAFSERLLRDYIYGNRRIEYQLAFVARALPRSTKTVLVIGCGSGHSAWFIAKSMPRATVTAVDISEANLDVARTLFRHPRVRYERCDVTQESVSGGPFDAVLLPDVYEHIPDARRPFLHQAINRLLAPRGRVLLTVPSIGSYTGMMHRGEGVPQPVEEPAGLDEMSRLACDVGGTIAYFSLVSVHRTNDYAHVVLERAAEETGAVHDAETPRLKRKPGDSKLSAFARRAAAGAKLHHVPRNLRRLRAWLLLRRKARGAE